LHVPEDYEGKLQAELGSLAWTLWMAGIIITTWTYQEWSRAGVVSAWKERHAQLKKVV
jgi:hypothetical protein